MKKIPLYCLLITFLTSACITPQRTTTTKTMDIYGAGVIQYPVIAELDVSDNSVSGTAQTSSGESIEVVKENAIADALLGTNADILVEPIFETVIDGRDKRATVRGFPATYTNFRSATQQDIQLLEAGILQRAETTESPQITEEDDNSTLKAVLGTLGIIGGAAAIGILSSE
jgi:hypothetical protein